MSEWCLRCSNTTAGQMRVRWDGPLQTLWECLMCGWKWTQTYALVRESVTDVPAREGRGT